MLRALRRKSPSMRESLWRSVRRWRYLGGSTESTSGSSPFCRVGALSYAMPSSALLGQDICPRACDLQPSTMLKWPENLPHFTELMLACSPGNTAHAEVVGELTTEFQKVEGHHLKLELPTVRICDLLLGPLLGRAWLADHLDGAAKQLRGELATCERQRQSWRLCGLRQCEFSAWCWATSMGQLHWRRPCPR
jgi:hypothetical protein